MILPMHNPLQDYAWGSRDYIQRLTGRTDLLGSPIAEMWMGAHPKAVSTITGRSGRIDLAAWITAHTDECLGCYADLNRGRLPFLMKVLAADEPLSIQAHPSKEQAERGFARENALGIPIDAPDRNYRDDNPKPELLCALTQFTALCGFRPHDQIRANLQALGVDYLLSAFPQFALHLDEANWKRVFRQILEAGRELVCVAESRFEAAAREPDPILAPAARLCIDLARRYPGDPGCLAPLYLNLVTLRPFEALYLDAGVLHAYISGAGIELMANSDNVLRGGLTPKHIDITELCSILSYHGSDTAPISGTRLSAQERSYPVPAREFVLGMIEADASGSIYPNPHHSPMILLCLEGECGLEDGDGRITLSRGASAFVCASTAGITITGKARLAAASCPA